MPEIKIKGLVSFSSEDKIHVAENILKSETYRKWKCALPGEKSAKIVLQFEKPSQIHSIDIGNESSAFIEVLVSRSSIKDFQVLLVASSFMSPLESRNENHTNRVRMFGLDKLAQNLKDEKWDCVQVVCTQPFNKNISYGLSFIKFHSPPDKHEDLPPAKEQQKTTTKLGAFRLKYEDDDEEVASPPSVSSWLQRKNTSLNDPLTSKKASPSSADASSPSLFSPQGTSVKRKADESEDISGTPKAKKDSSITRVNKEKIGYTDPMGSSKPNASPVANQPKNSKPDQKRLFPVTKPVATKELSTVPQKTTPNASRVAVANKIDKKVSFSKIMNKVTIVISGFVNPLRGEIRDKALEMGAKYKVDWDKSCTHLICAFANTPKYLQVRSDGGRIVTKFWVLDSHQKRTQLPWRKYMLGTYTCDSSADGSTSDSENERNFNRQKAKPKSLKTNGTAAITPYTIPKKKKAISSDSDSCEESNAISSKTHAAVSPSRSSNGQSLSKPGGSTASRRDESETEDEEALQDYIANTDVESGSGNDTEDEIRKVVESQTKKKKGAESQGQVDCLKEGADDSESLLAKPDTENLPLPQLTDLFKKRQFYLYGDFYAKKRHDLQRYITAYNGVIEDYMTDTVKYVITESQWDTNFDDALNDNEDLIFVKPEWIFKCQEKAKLVPYQPYIIIPTS